MKTSPFYLGLYDTPKTESIAQMCKNKAQDIDMEIAGDFGAWLGKTLRLCRGSSLRELADIAKRIDSPANRGEYVAALDVLWHVYYGSHFRKKLYAELGKEKTDAIYGWTRKHLHTRARRSALYANMLKCALLADFRKHIAKLSTEEFTTLVALVDAVTNTTLLNECNHLNLQQLSSTVAASAASTREQVIGAILPDPSAGIKGLIEKTFAFMKENINPAGKRGQTTEELCLELCATPCSVLLLTVAACVSGSSGLLLFMVPMFVAWSSFSAVSGVVKENDEGSDIHKFLSNTTKTLLTGDYRPDLQHTAIHESTTAGAQEIATSLSVTSSGSHTVVHNAR